MEDSRQQRMIFLEHIPEPSSPLRLQRHLSAEAVSYDLSPRSVDGVQAVHQGREVGRRILPVENNPANWICKDRIMERLPLPNNQRACCKK